LVVEDNQKLDEKSPIEKGRNVSEPSAKLVAREERVVDGQIKTVASTLEFEDQVDEVESIEIEAEGRRVRTKSSDPEIESLHGKWKRGKLVLQSDFQRQFVWDRKKASRLIESALLDVPLPVIYLAEEPDGKESVIDGQQRLSSFFSFIDGIFPDGDPFKLTGLQVYDELNRKAYGELSEEIQDKIRYYEIRTITILRDSNSDLKFEIFERLNTGSVPLNDMELRNCVYRGEYMQLLKELAADSEFLNILGMKQADRRMKDVELVLRFASFYHSTYLKYRPPMRRFFNRDMEKYQHIGKSDADELRRVFRNALLIVKSLFGGNAFKRFYRGDDNNPNGSWEANRFNASLFDVLMGTFADLDKNRVYAALDALREGLIDLMSTNQEFIESILLSTSAHERVKKRFDLTRKVIDDILESHAPQPRCFSLKLKKEMFEKDATCAICGQGIQILDDAAVDHIDQYWKGGKTIPENARLTHRYCNWARPRND